MGVPTANNTNDPDIKTLRHRSRVTALGKPSRRRPDIPEVIMSYPGLKRRALLTAAGLAAWMPARPNASTQTDWDIQPEIRPTDTVVSADLLRGPHYTLGETVTTLAYLNRYIVTSDYGPFIAPSDARLRRLLREIAAVGQLQAMQQTDAFEKAAIEAGKSPFRSARNLLDDPVGTLSAIPEGIGSIFNRAQEQMHRQGRSRYEDGPAKQLLAVSSYKRDYAAKLDVDAYSSNEVLQRELNRMGWASAAGNLTLGALSFVTGARPFRSLAMSGCWSRRRTSSHPGRRANCPNAIGSN